MKINITPTLILGDAPPGHVQADTALAARDVIRRGGLAAVNTKALAVQALIALGADPADAQARVDAILDPDPDPALPTPPESKAVVDRVHDLLESKARRPRDGDGDGRIHDGTPQERPAPSGAVRRKTYGGLTSKKDIKAFIKDLEAEGWRVEQRARHQMAYPPDPNMSPITIPGTPSDHRSGKNTLAQARRSGFRGEIE